MADDGATEGPDLSSLGDKTAGMLLSAFQDAYRQEIAAEEDVHRTLPFLATALGLAIAAVNYAFSQLPGWNGLVASCPCGRGILFNHHMLACIWPVLVATAFLTLSALLGIGVLILLAASTERRGYRRIGREADQIDRARALKAYHFGEGVEAGALDDAVHRDLREQILDDLAQAVTSNRDLTLRRYALRARAVVLLLASLLSALVATILTVATA